MAGCAEANRTTYQPDHLSRLQLVCSTGFDSIVPIFQVNGIAPGAVPGWEDWTPDDAQANTQKAMKAAQDHLGIAPVTFTRYHDFNLYL